MAMSSQSQSPQSGELTSDDLQKVFEAVYSITPNYVNFGMKLNVHLNTIRIIEMQYANPCDRLLQILYYRLNQLPHLTWHDIVRALRSPLLEQHDLARAIESQYITASQSSASVSQQASAESSHAAIHTSGAQPSTHAPSQPPLHTVTAASLAPHPPYDFLLPFYYQQYFQPQPPSQYVRHSSSQQANYFPSQFRPTYPYQHSFPMQQNSLTHLPIPQPAALPLNPLLPSGVGDGEAHLLANAAASSVDSSHIPLAQHPQHILTQHPQSFQDSTCTFYPPQFIAYVRDIYRRSIVGDCKDTKWPPRASEVFIKLAIIDRKRVSFREADEYTKAMVMDGNVDAILHKKRSIKLNEIAKDVPMNRIIVVEGAPGVGKSTFAWEFCRRWERGEIAQQYQLVLLLRLRDERMSRAHSLNDLIYHPDKVLCQSMQLELNVNHGRHVLFILEGFDELPDTCRAKSSIYMKLIDGIILYESTVLITSRPWATDTLHRVSANRIFQHIEILGFSEPQIKEYVTSALNNPDNDLNENAKDDFDDIIKYIDTYPQIKACMYIPLNAAIVVGVYEESKAGRCSIPKTLTQLYHALTQTILVRYLHGHREYSQQRWNVRDLKKDLPREVYAKLLYICSLAYKGIFNGENNIMLVFSDLPPDFETLDLMHSVPQMFVTRGEVMSHNFLHLTVQEYFCALHISFMSAESQLKHFQRHEDGRFRVLLRFLAGLTKLSNIAVEQFKGLLREVHGDEQQRDCCKHMVPDISVSVHYINWLFEAQNTDVLHNHTVSFKFTREMKPLEYYSVGYCVVHSNCNWSLGIRGDTEEEKIQMLSRGAESSDTKSRVALRTKESISSENLNILFTGFGPCLEEIYFKLADNGSSLSLTNLSALHTMELGMCNESTLNLSCDFSLQSLESLTINAGNAGSTLGLKSCEAIGKFLSSSTSLKELHFNSTPGKRWSMSTKGMEAITKGMSDNMALPLMSLEIECTCTFSNTAVKSLALFIRSSTTLKYTTEFLNFSNTGICDDGVTALAQALHHSSTLEWLDLSNNNISDAGAVVLAQALHDNSTLEKGLDLNFDNNSISDAGAAALAKVLHHNSILKGLHLDNNSISITGAVALAQALHHNSTLKRLVLSNNNISDAGAAILAQALHHNSTLKGLHLDNNSISITGAEALAQALHHNSTLEWLDLSNNNISDAGVVILAQALHHNSTLEWLDLCNNSISDTGAEALAQALYHQSALKNLVLSNNSIRDAGAAALGKALHHNSTLKKLVLCNNNISDAGAAILAQDLQHNCTLKGLYLSGNEAKRVLSTSPGSDCEHIH